MTVLLAVRPPRPYLDEDLALCVGPEQFVHRGVPVPRGPLDDLELLLRSVHRQPSSIGQPCLHGLPTAARPRQRPSVASAPSPARGSRVRWNRAGSKSWQRNSTEPARGRTSVPLRRARLVDRQLSTCPGPARRRAHRPPSPRHRRAAAVEDEDVRPSLRQLLPHHSMAR